MGEWGLSEETRKSPGNIMQRASSLKKVRLPGMKIKKANFGRTLPKEADESKEASYLTP